MEAGNVAVGGATGLFVGTEVSVGSDWSIGSLGGVSSTLAALLVIVVGDWLGVVCASPVDCCVVCTRLFDAGVVAAPHAARRAVSNRAGERHVLNGITFFMIRGPSKICNPTV